MASMWRKAMLYLGLGPDDEYEDDSAPDERPQPVAAAREPVGAPRSAPVRPRPAPAARPTAPSRAATPNLEPEGSSVRTLPPQQPAPAPAPAVEPVAAKPRAVVRPVPASASAKPHVVTPTSFNHAQEVADKFKANQPVIVNLQGAERDLARRLIDFSSGLCYGLGGHMEKVAHQVYLLTPSNVEVSADERRRLLERGLHDA